MRYKLMLIGLLFIGCASTAPLPATLNIVPPSLDVPSEIAAFSGIWDGQWWGFQDAILVVEKIDLNKAELILSYGLSEGYEPRYFYVAAVVADGPTLKCTAPNGDELIYKIDRKTNELHGTLIEKRTGAKYKLIFHKRNQEQG